MIKKIKKTILNFIKLNKHFKIFKDNKCKFKDYNN